MAFLELNIFSQALGTEQQVFVIMPQQETEGQIGISSGAAGKARKCLYLLHGLSDNHTIWQRRTSIERYAQQYGLCVVMPFGDRSFYTDMRYGGKYYTYIAKELPQIIGQLLQVSSQREDTFIAGISMGGYGALKIGLRESHRFCAAAGLSAVADIGDVTNRFESDMINIFGPELQIPPEEDLFSLAETCSRDPQRPRIFMGVGTEDFLYESNVQLKEKFQTLPYDYTYMESPGTHCWDFWDVYIQHVLQWLFETKDA